MIQERVDVKRMVLMWLKVGKPNAITERELVYKLGMRDGRAVRLAIRELIAHGWPIASSVNKPYGYYIIGSRAEAQEYVAVMRARIREDALRLKDFKRASRKIVVPEQLSLV